MSDDGEAITILIVDDHQMFADSISRFLDHEDDIKVLGVAATVSGAVTLAQDCHPDVAIVDFQLPDGNGAEAARKIQAVAPETRVLILTGLANEQALAAAISAGCAGFVTKDKAIQDLVMAVRMAQGGETYVPTGLLAGLISGPSRIRATGAEQLTARERQILELVADGMGNQAIAQELTVSVHTVRNHVQNILSKLHAHSKLEAVAIASRAGLLSR